MAKCLQSCRTRWLSALIGPLLALPLAATCDVSAVRAQSVVSSDYSYFGSYLAARFARNAYDTGRAANYYRFALSRDPKNPVLIEQTFLMEIAEGKWQSAANLAGKLIGIKSDHHFARTFLGLHSFRDKQYKRSLAHFEASSNGVLRSELTSSLARAWTLAAAGRRKEALALLEATKLADWAGYYVDYHRALLADLAGQHRVARDVFTRLFQREKRTLRLALAFARHAAQEGEPRLALETLREHTRAAGGNENAEVRMLRRAISAGERPSFLVTDATAGISEVFYGIGEALTGGGLVSNGRTYLHMSLMMQPDAVFAKLALANLHEVTKDYRAAIEIYDTIPRSSPFFPNALIWKSIDLDQLEKTDEAVATLNKLIGEEAGRAASTTTSEGVKPGAPPAKVAQQPAERPAPIRFGARGAEVRSIQEALKRIGFYQAPADGLFGPALRAAVRSFERDYGLKPTAGLSGEVQQLLASEPLARLQVTDVQSALGKAGFDVGQPDGVLGPRTREGIRKLQRANNIAVDGRLGPETLKALGLDTAAETGRSTLTAADLAADEHTEREGAVRVRRDALITLGNIQRGRKRYAEGAETFSKAIALVDKPDQRHWSLFYSRGTCYERIKKWELAEADLKKALELKPDQPLVLNYLGYSWIDQGRNLERGLALIERAVKLKPDDGYIVDSLGWAHFKLGNFKEAVKYLERAVELRPEDPILNDHLGDAYWRVGREREARFQWEQSLKLKPEPEDETKTRRKLTEGLAPLKSERVVRRSRDARNDGAGTPPGAQPGTPSQQ